METVYVTKEICKPKSQLDATFVSRGHFHYSGNWSEKEELSIYMSGIYAKIFGWLFRAKQW